MCSIGGFISHAPLDRHMARRLASALIWYGSERGVQSSGCYTNGKLAKKAIPPAEFLETSDFFNLFQTDTNMALTHTRQPTSGDLGDAQAQPFVCGGTVTAHNGMIFNIEDVKKRWHITKPSGVDSELITTYLSTHGITKFADFVESTDGVSAVAAIHKGQMYLMRSGNPTFWTKLTWPDNSMIIFASTEEMLHRAIHYTWLMPKDINIQGTQQYVLLNVTPTKMKAVSKKIRPTSYGWDYLDLSDEIYGKYFSGTKWRKHETQHLLTGGMHD